MNATPEPADPGGAAAAAEILDPDHDPQASYAIDQTMVRRLTGLLTASSGESVKAVSPITGQPLGYIPQSTAADVEEAFRRARKAQAEWARTSLKEREALFMRLHDIVLERQDEIMDLICWESGKARKHAFDEPLHIALTARYYARTGNQHLGTKRVAGVVPGLTHVEVNRIPKGVVGIISPWNYPFTMALCDGLPALKAGNAVVSKPDAQTMLTALLGLEMLHQAGFPKDLWQVVAGPGRVLGSEIIDRSDYICFTGSTATGKLIAKQCADRLIGCSLELGGKNPILILRDADLDRAAEGAVRAAFSNAGQLCVSMERMFVADQVYDRFMQKFVDRVNAMSLGASPDWGVDMGSLISSDQLDTVVEHVEDAKAKGARVLTGGRARPDLGPYFYEPTVLENVQPGMQCFGDESFGPVISVYRFTDEADAIDRANEGQYGLNASIYTRDTKRGRRDREADQVRHGQRQRGVRRDVREHRVPDGRHARIRHGTQAGRRGHPPLHRAAVGRHPAAAPVRPVVRHERQAVRRVHDRVGEAHVQARQEVTPE